MNKKLVNVVTKPILRKEIDRLKKNIVRALTLLKVIEKEVKSTSKAAGVLNMMQKQLTELNKQVAAISKEKKGAVKKPRKLTEMNLFIREQIKSGKSFVEAIQAWKDYKATKQVQSVEAKEPEGSHL
ncbi:MAG: hypothetical protein ACUVTL_08770 [Thermoproteota archaeon]